MPKKKIVWHSTWEGTPARTPAWVNNIEATQPSASKMRSTHKTVKESLFYFHAKKNTNVANIALAVGPWQSSSHNYNTNTKNPPTSTPSSSSSSSLTPASVSQSELQQSQLQQPQAQIRLQQQNDDKYKSLSQTTQRKSSVNSLLTTPLEFGPGFGFDSSSDDSTVNGTAASGNAADSANKARRIRIGEEVDFRTAIQLAPKATHVTVESANTLLSRAFTSFADLVARYEAADYHFPVYVADLDGVYLWANERYLAIPGVVMSDLFGTRIENVFAAMNLPFMVALIYDTIVNKPPVIEFLNPPVRRSAELGSTTTWRVRGNRIDDPVSGAPLFYVWHVLST